MQETPAALADRLFEAELAACRAGGLRRPGATYRVQLHKGFRFLDLLSVLDFIHDLGITDVYLSPYLRAKPGSTHGYDVFDHGRLNPEIGDEEDHRRLVEGLADRGMGRLLDIVPNHMGITGRNMFWHDVLECGAISPSSQFFDIDWHPVKDELENRVLLAILGDQYGKVLEAGQLVLEREGGAFFLRYYETRLPIAPWSYATILGRCIEELQRRFPQDDEQALEYRSIWASAHHLPQRGARDPEAMEQTLREKEVMKRRIERLCAECPELCRLLDEAVASFAGTPEDAASWDALHQLLEQQVYRLSYWRVAAEEINYRRFFDINDLAGLRTEDPRVFDAIHRLIFRWVDEGGVVGLRIDHPDGLANPREYFERLQETLFLRACRRRFDAGGIEADWRDLADPIRARYRAEVAADTASSLVRRFPVVAEKILSRSEDLPEDWPIDGTVGYEYLNALSGLFVDGSACETLSGIYGEYTGDRTPFPDVLYESKQLIARSAMASELNMLARQLNRVSERDRRSRDFTLNELHRAIREVIACFPVYRTYLESGRPIAPRDVEYIDQALARARRRNPAIDVSVFTFIREALLLAHPAGSTREEVEMREKFVVRFQQTTGPVQAKGLEDTAFYRQFPLVSLNEVGADPARFGSSPSTFHALNHQRHKTWPGGLSTSATHDTKRGEDTRIRISVLSELAEDWRIHLNRWSRWNSRKKPTRDDRTIPDAREEYLLYQTLIGVWPFDATEESLPDGFVRRVQEFMTKAVREAKLNTSWTDSDTSYVEDLNAFVAEVLSGPDAAPFLKDFVPFQRRVARIGGVHSLSQVLLKLASPGVPDVYQGCELWDFSLVDPDNRRPVDFELRRRMFADQKERLASGISREELARGLFASPEDGGIKLYLTWTILGYRRENLDLFTRGSYRGVEADGERKANVVAFARSHEGRTALAVAPRLVSQLVGSEEDEAPAGPAAWGETRLVLPENLVGVRWRDVLTDTVHDPDDPSCPGPRIADLFRAIPAALLIAEG